MDKQSLSFLQRNTNSCFSDIINFTCQFGTQNLCKVFVQWDFTFVASPQLVFQNQVKPDYISLACECKRREWREKFLPFSAHVTSWAQWHLFPACYVTGDLHAWPWLEELSPPWWLLSQELSKSLPRAERGRPTMDLGSGEVAYSSLRLFGLIFFHLDKATS